MTIELFAKAFSRRSGIQNIASSQPPPAVVPADLHANNTYCSLARCRVPVSEKSLQLKCTHAGQNPLNFVLCKYDSESVFGGNVNKHRHALKPYSVQGRSFFHLKGTGTTQVKQKYEQRIVSTVSREHVQAKLDLLCCLFPYLQC